MKFSDLSTKGTYAWKYFVSTDRTYESDGFVRYIVEYSELGPNESIMYSGCEVYRIDHRKGDKFFTLCVTGSDGIDRNFSFNLGDEVSLKVTETIRKVRDTI